MKQTVYTFTQQEIIDILTDHIKDKISISNTKQIMKENIDAFKLQSIDLIIEELPLQEV